MDNQAGFLEAFGSAFATGVPGHVNAKELHSLAHDREAGVLEDTAMLGDTAVVNRTEVGVAREIVAPDGSAMRVTARWDGDVWVEVDEDLVLETRRWREGDFLVFARTVTRDDGTLVTSKMFMGKPRRKAPVFAAPAPDPSLAVKSRKSSKKSKKSKKSAEAAMDEDADAASDAGSDAESVYSHVEKAVETATGMFSGLFGGSKSGERSDAPDSRDGSSRRAAASSAALSARGAAKPRDAAAFFHLNPSASFCGSFLCSLRNHLGHLYVFEFHVGFAALNLTEHAKWHAPAKAVNNLEIVGASSLLVGLTTGLNLEFEGVDDRDAVYECMVSMLEKIPPSPGEEVHGEPDARVAAPLRLGFEQERYVFVHVAQAEALPAAATGSVSIATAALGRYGAAVTAKNVTLVNAPSRFGRTLAFPAAEADLAGDAVMVAVAGGGVGDAGFGSKTLGEAQIPLAMLPRDRAGADEVKENPYVVALMPPGELGGDERDPGSRASESPRAGGRAFRRDGDGASAKARASRAVGRLSVVAWIGTTSDLYELGNAATLAEPPAELDESTGHAPSMAPSASVRVPPAVSRVTVNVHKVRGVAASRRPGGLRRVAEEAVSGDDADAGDLSEEDADIVELKCRLRIGDQISTTATALHSGTDQARWGPSTRQFIAMEPRGGAMRVELLLASDETCVGCVDVDISSLPMRPAKGAYARAHWLKLRAPRPEDADDASSAAGGSAARRGARGSGSRSSRASSRRSKTRPTGVSRGGDQAQGGGFFGFSLTGPSAVVPAASAAVEETETESLTSDSDDESSYDDESATNGDGDEEYLGEILLDGFVDEGCGPTAAIGRKAPLGELSLEILSMRGVTPEGKRHRARPAVLLEMGGSWAHLPAAAAGDGGRSRAPPAWRREIVAAAYDPADVAQIGVFDAAERNAPLGFARVPISRLPRGATVVSTLALSGGAAAKEISAAEITIRARYTPATSAAAQLFAYMAPPLPRSAYVHGAEQSVGEGVESGVDALVRQQREYAEESLTEGPAALPASMVGAMLPRGARVRRSEKRSKLKSAKNIKACVVRIAAAVDPFHLEITFIKKAVTWASPWRAGLLHVLLALWVYHPATALFASALWLAARAAGQRRTRRWTLVGADKSPDAGSFDVGRAPPGSRLAGAEAAAALGPDAPSELASEELRGARAGGARGAAETENHSGVSAAGLALGVNPRAETYEFLVQVFYWVQALARHFAPHCESLHALMTWKDTARSHAFMVACFASAFAFLFVKWRFLALALCFVALRHPVAGKPATAPYRLALAADP